MFMPTFLRFQTLSFIAAPILLLACAGHHPSQDFPVDPQYKITYPIPRSSALLPVKVGQWVRFKDVSTSGVTTYQTIRITDRVGNAFWQETLVEMAGHQPVTIRALIEFSNYNSPKPKKVLGLGFTNTEGEKFDYSSGIVEWMMRLFSPSVDLGLGVVGVQEDIRVPAGMFKGAFKTPFKIQSLIGSQTGLTWWYPSVPLGGIVRMTSDKALFRLLPSMQERQLVAFGHSRNSSSAGLPSLSIDGSGPNHGIQLRQLARFPRKALERWKTLKVKERDVILEEMTRNYGKSFTNDFNEYAFGIKKPNLSVTVFQSTPKELIAKGYRYAGTGNTWVHPSGHEILLLSPSKPETEDEDEDDETKRQCMNLCKDKTETEDQCNACCANIKDNMCRSACEAACNYKIE